MKVCNTIELTTPTSAQISNIIDALIPNINEKIKEKFIGFVPVLSLSDAIA